jgi:hypothetical protein
MAKNISRCCVFKKKRKERKNNEEDVDANMQKWKKKKRACKMTYEKRVRMINS